MGMARAAETLVSEAPIARAAIHVSFVLSVKTMSPRRS
jgi:hypothetical protein